MGEVLKITAMMPVRSEDWCLGLSAHAVLQWCDSLVILNHCSTDGTEEILNQLQAEYGERLSVLTESDPQWSEMAHRQRMLEWARGKGATHLAIVDADEVLTGNLLPHIRGMVEAAPKGSILQLPWLCLRGSIDRYHVDGIWGSSNVSTAFKDEPRCHWAAREGYDFHHRHPCGRSVVPFRPVFNREGGLMHLQFVSDRRLRAKQALYKLTELLRWPGRESVETVDRRYNVAVYGQETTPSNAQALTAEKIIRGSRDMPGTKDKHGLLRYYRVGSHQLSRTPSEWWEPYSNLMGYLNPDAEPWQEAECKRLLAEHGESRFAGLDLFGIAA